MPSRYDACKHHRRSIRLKDHDYTSPGAYFVTIMTHEREYLFENVIFRRIAEYNWKAIARHFENVLLDEWIVMPNHIHGIIVITEEARERNACKGEAFAKTHLQYNQDRTKPITFSDRQDMANASPLRARGAPPCALGAIIGNFKSVTRRCINTIRKTRGAAVWHRNYYGHIVRNEREQDQIREYITANPSRWAHDTENVNAQIANDVWLANEKIWFLKSNLIF